MDFKQPELCCGMLKNSITDLTFLTPAMPLECLSELLKQKWMLWTSAPAGASAASKWNHREAAQINKANRSTACVLYVQGGLEGEVILESKSFKHKN